MQTYDILLIFKIVTEKEKWFRAQFYVVRAVYFFLSRFYFGMVLFYYPGNHIVCYILVCSRRSGIGRLAIYSYIYYKLKFCCGFRDILWVIQPNKSDGFCLLLSKSAKISKWVLSSSFKSFSVMLPWPQKQ